QWKPQNNPTLRPGLCQIAWAGDQVAGMVLIFINEQENRRRGKQRAETESICIRKPWRRQGLAKALIARALQTIKRASMAEAALTVDAQNLTGAADLYQAKGYRTTRRSIAYRRPLRFVNI